MSKIIQAFKENAKEEHWLSPQSEKAVREKVQYIKFISLASYEIQCKSSC
jgi:hypothetical protein